MPPTLALLLCFILLLSVFRHDRATIGGFSAALWVPFIWMALLGSRSASLWLDFRTSASSVTAALEEGNPLDHAVYLTLTILAVAILVKRHFNWRNLVTLNTGLVLLLLFSLLSVTWSDFPFASFRRWIRELGNYLMPLVLLSDPRPLKAIEALLRRLSFFVISISVVLIKYFPDVGVTYSFWTGEQQFVGITTGKNSLGVLCLISGVLFFWDVLRRWPDRRAPKVIWILLVDIVFLWMTVWLLLLSQSATSQLCLVIGCLVLTLAHYGPIRIRHNFTRTIPIAACLGLVLEFTFNVSDVIIQLLGRDPTLTGRTDIWTTLLNLKTNPVFGVGFASFWLGDRMLSLWETTKLVGLQEAHNGYLETYLELGIVGLCMLCSFLVASYRTICKRLAVSRDFASLSLTFWLIVLIYNVAEASFRNNLLWVTFLLVGIAVPASSVEANLNKRGAAGEGRPWQKPHGRTLGRARG